MVNKRVPFYDFSRYVSARKGGVQEALSRVFDRGVFILGPEVQAFEQAYSLATGTDWSVGCANGTDAIEIGLRLLGVSPGVEVVTTPMTAMPTLMAIAATGAKIVLADIDSDTGLIDTTTLADAISLKTACIVPVHLYGQLCNMPDIMKLADTRKIEVLEDCAQAHGASGFGKRAGHWSKIAAWSFYPTKNLGAFGDAGAITGFDLNFENQAKRLRNYGQEKTYCHEVVGRNSRLDEIQAAWLLLKLETYEVEQIRRKKIAEVYRSSLKDKVKIVSGAWDEDGCNYHLFVIKLPGDRDRIRRELDKVGVGTLVHYPKPAHLQRAFFDLGYHPGAFPRAEAFAESVLSLPCNPYMTDDEVEYVAKSTEQLL